MPWVIVNRAQGTTLATAAEVARGWRKRALGLLARRSLQAGEALIIPHCWSIHTLGMRFPIDVLFLRTIPNSKLETRNSKHLFEGIVVKATARLPSCRMAWAWGSDTVVELPAGTLTKTATATGATLSIFTSGVTGSYKQKTP